MAHGDVRTPLTFQKWNLSYCFVCCPGGFLLVLEIGPVFYWSLLQEPQYQNYMHLTFLNSHMQRIGALLPSEPYQPVDNRVVDITRFLPLARVWLHLISMFALSELSCYSSEENRDREYFCFYLEASDKDITKHLSQDG